MLPETTTTDKLLMAEKNRIDGKQKLCTTDEFSISC